MDPSLIGAVVGAITAVIAALVGLNTPLGKRILSGATREETAVQQMANLLEANAVRDEKREAQFLAMLDKSLDTMNKLTAAIPQIALQVQGHERDATLRWTQTQDDARQTRDMLTEISGEVKALSALLTDALVTILERQRRREEGEQE